MRYFSFLYIFLFFTTLIQAQIIEYNKCKYSIISDNTASLLSFNISEKKTNQGTLILDSVVLHKKKRYKVVEIEENAFKLNSITTYLNHIKRVDFPSTLVEISSNVFNGKFNSLQMITIPYNTKFIGYNTFANLPSLTEIDVKGISKVNDWSFSLNPSLSYVHLDTCVHIIGKNTFFNCTRLKTINLENVKLIDEHAFEGTALENLNIPNCRIIGEFAFADCRKISKIEFSNSIYQISNFAFYNNTALKSLFIPSGIIGESAFMGCTSLNNVVLSDRIESIGQAAFFGCSALNDISLPSSMARIEAMTFMDCINLKSITLPNSLTFIGESAFENSGLVEVIVPANVKEIQNNAFRNCDKLTKIIVLNSNILIGDNAFDKNVFIEFSK